MANRIVSRLKKSWPSARAAWMDIARQTGTSPSTHNLKRMDTKTHFRWEVLGRKKVGGGKIRRQPIRR